MCELSLYPPGVEPVGDHLLNAVEPNPDGAGFAIVMDGYIIVRKSMNGVALAEEFTVARHAYPARWAGFHTRLASALKPAPQHCHPFTVGGDTRTVLFHNGSIPDLADDPDRTDSQRLAEDMLGEDSIAHCMGVDWLGQELPQLERIIGPGNKVAVLSADPDRDECVIVNRDQWLVTPQGVLWSNADYLGKGTGWDEMTIGGHLFRFNLPVEGQCGRCNLFHRESENDCDRDRVKEPPRWRDETERIAGLR